MTNQCHYLQSAISWRITLVSASTVAITQATLCYMFGFSVCSPCCCECPIGCLPEKCFTHLKRVLSKGQMLGLEHGCQWVSRMQIFQESCRPLCRSCSQQLGTLIFLPFFSSVSVRAFLTRSWKWKPGDKKWWNLHQRYSNIQLSNDVICLVLSTCGHTGPV